MKLESRKLNIKHVDLGPLTELQTLYYSFLRSGLSIEGLTEHYFKLGWLLSFTDLYNLLERLYKKSALLDPEFAEIFEPKSSESRLQQWKDWLSLTPTEAPDLAEFPFFRTLDSQLLKVFQNKAQVFRLGPRTRVCRMGEVKRDLFVSLSGDIDVYKNEGWVTSIPPKSIFGEVSFFLGEPRTAEVVTRSESEILRIRFDDQFQELINTSKAEAVLQRFWLIHALNSSKLFKALPEETFDQILNTGTLRRFKAGETLFAQGDAGNRCWIVVQGQIEIRQQTQQDSQQQSKVISQTQRGDLVGEVALMINQGKRTAGARCLSDTVALEIDQKLFYKLLSLNFVLGYQIEKLAQSRILDDQKRAKVDNSGRVS